MKHEYDWGARKGGAVVRKAIFGKKNTCEMLSFSQPCCWTCSSSGILCNIYCLALKMKALWYFETSITETSYLLEGYILLLFVLSKVALKTVFMERGWMIMAKTAGLGEKPCQCHFVHQKSHAYTHSLRSGPLRWEAENWLPERLHGLLEAWNSCQIPDAMLQKHIVPQLSRNFPRFMEPDCA